MLWFGFVLSVIATLQVFSSHGKVFWLFPSGYSDYVMGPFPSRNHYAAFMEAILPMALSRALQSEKDSLLYSGMAAAMYASIIASASRAGTLLATGEIVAVVLLLWAGGRTRGSAVGISLLRILAAFAVFTGVAGWQSVWQRFWVPDPVPVRPELAISTIRMITAHPWSGVGLGTWSTVYPHYAIVDVGAFANQAHNDWLQWAAEGGVPFGLVMASLFFWCLPRVRYNVWGLGVVAVFLHALVDYPFSRSPLGCWTVLVLAMLAAAPPQAAESTGLIHPISGNIS